MSESNDWEPFELFSTCPQSAVVGQATYLQKVIEVARWSERAGCRGILVYSDNTQLDVWMLSQLIVRSTEYLSPLVAVQPVYMHPYAVAKIVATFGYLFERQMCLNMVAGGFKNDLIALNDTTPHDERYARLSEYTEIIRRLLETSSLVSYTGKYYKVENLKMAPRLDPQLAPTIFVSGSSEAGLAAARALGATAVHYPEPPDTYAESGFDDSIRHGMRMGIIARESEAEAWEVAYNYFPEDRKGQLTQQLAMKVSDSVWHKQLSRLGVAGPDNPYWLFPFQNYKTQCPYLVGSYEQVSADLERYIRAGIRTLILDIPKNEEDFSHTNIALDRALDATRCQNSCRIG